VDITTVSFAGRSTRLYFEEAVDDNDEFWDIGGYFGTSFSKLFMTKEL